MARRYRAPTLETRSARLKLKIRGKPYWTTIGAGLSLGYRRNEGNGSWSGRKSNGAGGNYVKRVGPADDFENIPDAIDYWTAQSRVRELFLGGADRETRKLVTVGEAIAEYREDLETRGGDLGNAVRIEHHVPPTLKAKIVASLSVRELKAFRKELLDKGLARSTVSRTNKALAAALSLATAHDPRVKNRDAWRTGLAKLPDDDDEAPREHVILSDDQVRRAVASAAPEGEAFEMFVTLGALTGARPVQLRRLLVSDVMNDAVSMPSSKKGKGKRTIKRRPVPVPASVVARLRAMCKGRASTDPLLMHDGKPWTKKHHRDPFRRVAERCKLDPDAVTFYSLRHSWITKQLIRGTPIRLVADAADTSVAMIEKTYSKYITHHGDDLLRAGMVDLTVPPEGPKVVPLR